jgi:hypothetical protein
MLRSHFRASLGGWNAALLSHFRASLGGWNAALALSLVPRRLECRSRTFAQSLCLQFPILMSLM